MNLIAVILCFILVNAVHAAENNPDLISGIQNKLITPDQKAQQVAQGAISLGRLQEAEADLLNILKQSPTSSTASYWLGTLYMEKGETDKAINYFTKSIANNPANIAARISLANTLYAKNDLQSAATEYEFILRLKPGNVTARANLANIKLTLGDLDSAIQEYTKIIRTAPSNPKAKEARSKLNILYFRKAEKLISDLSGAQSKKNVLDSAKHWISQNQLNTAQWLLTEFLKRFPDDMDANYLLAVIFINKGELQTSVKFISKAVTEDANNITYLRTYGDLLARIGKLDLAIQTLQKVVSLSNNVSIKDSTKSKIELIKGEVLARKGDLNAALNHYLLLLNEDQKDITLLNRIANIYISLGDTKKAEDALQKIVVIKGLQKQENVLLNQARTELAQGKYEKARPLLKRIIEHNPKSSKAYYWLSVVDERQNRQESAISNIKMSIRLAPDNIALKEELARLLVGVGRAKEAIKMYETLAQRQTNIAKKKELLRLGSFIQGQYYMQSAQYEKAKNHYLKMSKQFDQDIPVFEALASVYVKLKQYKAAEKTYLKALSLNKKRAATYLRLAALYTQMNLLLERRNNYQQAMRYDPTGRVGQYALNNMLSTAQTLLDMGSLDTAYEEYQAIMAVFPNNKTAVANAALVTQQLGKYEDSKILYRRAIDNNPKNFRLRVKFARMLVSIDDLDGAITEFEKIFSYVPTSTEGREANANLDILYNARADQIIHDMETDEDRKSAVDTARIWIQEKNRTDPAKRILKAVLEQDEQNEKAHYWLGAIYDRYRLFDLAILHTATSVSLAPYNLQLVFAFGRVLARAGNLSAAEALYKNILQESKGTKLATVTKKSLGFIVGQRLIRDGNLDAALVHYKKMYRIYPDDVGLLARIANVYLSKGELRNAERTFEQVIIEEPNSPSVYLQIAKLYEKKGDENARIAALKKVIALDPNGLLGRQALNSFGLADGIEKLKQGQWRLAIESIDGVLAIEPENIYANLAKASAYLGLSEFTNAEILFKKVLAQQPGNLEARLKLARVYIATKRTTQAVVELERVVAASRGTSEGKEALVNLTNIYRQRGAALLGQGRGDDAVREYRKAVARDPKDWQAHYALGQLFKSAIQSASVINKSRFRELAIYHFEQTARNKPDYIQAYINLGTIFETGKEYDKARDAFNNALSLVEDDSPIKNVLINAVRIQLVRKEFTMRNFEWSLKELKDMIKLEPDSARLYLFLGIVYISTGDLEAAIDATKTAVKLRPEDVTARYRLGQLYEQTNDLERAADQYRSIIFQGKQDTIVDASRERLEIVEEKLRVITFRLRYSNAVGQSQIGNTPIDRNFSSTIQINMVAHYRPQKNVDLSFNASPTYSAFHDTESDSIASTYGLTGVYNTKDSFFTASINRRKIGSLLIEQESGKELTSSIIASQRLEIPLLLSEKGAVTPSTVQWQFGTRKFEAEDNTQYKIQTYSITPSFAYSFSRGGSLSLNYQFADTQNLDIYSKDYANVSHNFTLSVSKPVATRLFGFLSVGVLYEKYKFLDSNQYIRSDLNYPNPLTPIFKRRKTVQATLSFGLNYQLHPKLNFFVDFSYIDHRTNVNTNYIVTEQGLLAGLQSIVLRDYKTSRLNGGIQFRF